VVLISVEDSVFADLAAFDWNDALNQLLDDPPLSDFRCPVFQSNGVKNLDE